MRLIVNGVERTLPESIIATLKAQFATLEVLLNKENIHVSDWLEKFNGNDGRIAVILKQAKLKSLSTDVGLAFLKSRFPCPAREISETLPNGGNYD